MKLTYHEETNEVYEVDLDFLKQEFARELAEWELMNPGVPITVWVQEVWEEAGECEGFIYSEDESTYSQEIIVEE